MFEGNKQNALEITEATLQDLNSKERKVFLKLLSRIT